MPPLVVRGELELIVKFGTETGTEIWNRVKSALSGILHVTKSGISEERDCH